MRRNLLSCGVSTIYNYLSIHFVIYPDIVSISESFKTLTYINVGTAVGSPVIFMEPQIGFFFQRRAELKPSCPRSSTYLSSLYSVKHSIMSKTLFITRQDVFAHTQTSAKKKIKMSLRVHIAADSCSSSGTAVPACTAMKILDCGLSLTAYSIWHGGNLILDNMANFPSFILTSHFSK